MMRSNFSGENGFSVVELMVSIFILSIVTLSLFQGLQMGDRIRGRANALKIATTLAFNEAERIRNSAVHGQAIEDSTYGEVVRGIPYTINRKKVVAPEFTGIAAQYDHSVELEISVVPDVSSFPSCTFKLVQGLQW